MKKHRTHTEYMTLSSDSDSEKVPLPKVDGTVSGKNFKNEKKKYEEEDAKAPKQSPIMISSGGSFNRKNPCESSVGN